MKFIEQQPEIFGQIINGRVIPDPSFVMEAETARQEAQNAPDATITKNEGETSPEAPDVEEIINTRIKEATNAIREEVGGVMEQMTTKNEAEREIEKKSADKERETFGKEKETLEKEMAKKDKLIASLEEKLGKRDTETKGLLERIKNALLDG